jgi:hypothetical protein
MIITYYTFMMLSYFVEGEQVTHNIVFPSYDACSYSKEAMFDTFEPHYDTVILYCKGTNVMSKDIIKPRVRPEYGN